MKPCYVCQRSNVSTFSVSVWKCGIKNCSLIEKHNHVFCDNCFEIITRCNVCYKLSEKPKHDTCASRELDLYPNKTNGASEIYISNNRNKAPELETVEQYKCPQCHYNLYNYIMSLKLSNKI